MLWPLLLAAGAAAMMTAGHPGSVTCPYECVKGLGFSVWEHVGQPHRTHRTGNLCVPGLASSRGQPQLRGFCAPAVRGLQRLRQGETHQGLTGT